MMQGVTILGSTGSIGMSTLDVIRCHPNRFRIIALTANRNVERMLQQCLVFKPHYAVMADKDSALRLRAELNAQSCEVEVLAGVDGLETVAALDETDYVMAAIVGAAGLLPTLAAARAGKRVLLANKEALVMSGALFMEAIEESGAILLPVDSEHNAIFQCMPKNGQPDKSVEKILLTASGGPFRTRDLVTLKEVTPEEAVAHPNWDMGRKISVDSATMMNKGLEVIEACWLFGVDTSRVEVVIHPQSMIHSMVAYNDGSVLAELGEPDMRTPIAHALAWPERIHSGVPIVDMLKVAQLDFEAPDFKRFPCLKLAYQAHQQGSCATIALNAANEIAVDAFLQGQIRFTEIAVVVENVLGQTREQTMSGLEGILQQDQKARRLAQQGLRKYHCND